MKQSRSEALEINRTELLTARPKVITPEEVLSNPAGFISEHAQIGEGSKVLAAAAEV